MEEDFELRKKPKRKTISIDAHRSIHSVVTAVAVPAIENQSVHQTHTRSAVKPDTPSIILSSGGNFKVDRGIKQELQPKDEYLSTEQLLKVCKRAESFNNGWRLFNRSDLQTPFAFAEAGFECEGIDKVICRRCNKIFHSWKPTDVPLIEHMKISNCPFVIERNKNVSASKNVKFAIDNELCEFDEITKLTAENPRILYGSLVEFLTALLKTL